MRISQYISSEQAPTGLDRPMQSGASPLGQALQGAGQTATRAGLDILARQKEIRDRTAVIQGVAAWQAEESERFRQAQNAAPIGAPDFTKNFLSDYDERVSKAAEAMPSMEARAAFTERALSYRASLQADAMAFEARAFGDARKAEVENALLLATNALLSDPSQYETVKGDLLSGLDTLKGAFPEQVVAELRRGAEQQLADAHIRGVIRRNPSAALGMLNSGDFDAVLDPRDKSVLLNAADAEIKRQEAAARAEAVAQRAGRLSDLEIAVARGEAGLAEIEQAYNDGNGWLSPAERTRLTLKADGILAEQQEEAAALGRVDEALLGRTVLDPASSDDRNAVDAHYALVSQRWADLPPDEFAQRTAEYIDTVGIVPPSLRGRLRGAIRSGSPEQKIAAADLIDRINTSNPAALTDFEEQDIALAVTTGQLVRAGMEPPEALRQAEQAVLEADQPQREMRAARLQADKLTADYLSDLGDEFDPGVFSWQPDIPEAMAGEFSRLFEAAFLNTGDEEAANRIAVQALKRTWAMTGVDGSRRLMKYAPEAVYGVLGGSDDTEWMRNQLVAEAQSIDPTLEEDAILLASDSRTARDLTYPIMRRNEFGAFVPLLKDGAPVRWRPDWSSSEAAAEAAKEREEEIDRARAMDRSVRQERETRRGRVEQVGRDQQALEQMRRDITGE